MKGKDFHAWASMCGLPATFAALAINPPLALMVGAATAAVWKFGTARQAHEDAEKLATSVSREREIRVSALAQARAKWDEEFEQLTGRCERGEVSEDEGEALFEALIARWPE